MDITISENNEVTVFTLSGRMDAITVKSFEDACNAKLDDNVNKIVVNLQDLQYISSAGLRGILIIEKKSRAQGGRIAFCALQKMVAEVFRISGFMSILSVHETQDEATEAVLKD